MNLQGGGAGNFETVDSIAARKDFVRKCKNLVFSCEWNYLGESDSGSSVVHLTSFEDFVLSNGKS